MISYLKFKRIFEQLDGTKGVEISLKDQKDTYMIIKYKDYTTFQKCGSVKDNIKEIKVQSLEDIYNKNIINNFNLKSEWNNIDDILINGFSIIYNSKEFTNIFGIII